MESEELHAKYQRLGQEYQKARAQVTVLKKAVLDEQASSKALQEALKQRDQSIRKYEQDIDSLQFRNSQLSKRVEILQNELDEYERKGVKPSKQPSSQTSISFIHEQELQMKIAENESLHKQLQESSNQHKIVLHHLESRLEILEREKSSYEQSIDDCQTKSNTIIERMKEEQHLLDAKLHKQEEDLKFANIMTEKYSQQLKDAQAELRSKLAKTNKMIQEKIPFIDTANVDFNKFNLPVCDRNHQHKSRVLIEVLTNQMIVFMAGMSDYHTYLEQRIKVHSIDIKQEEITPVNLKFSSHLLSNAQYSRNIQHSLKKLKEEAQTETFIALETLSSFDDVVNSLKQYVKYLEKLMPYRILSINEESRSSSWSEHLEQCNNKILYEEKKIYTAIKKLVTYITLLALKNTSASCTLKAINVINETLETLTNSYKALCVIFVEKSEEEHSLPTYTERLKTTDECLLSTLHSLETSTGKPAVFHLTGSCASLPSLTFSNMFNLSSVFKENISFMLAVHGFVRKGLPSDRQLLSGNVRSFFNDAVGYMNVIKQDVTPSVPYVLAVNNYRTIITSTEENDTLTQQAENTQENLVKLEAEKEHWMLEAQLIKAKYEREVKKTNLLGEELKKIKTESALQRTTSLEDNIKKDQPIMKRTHAQWMMGLHELIKKGFKDAGITSAIEEKIEPSFESSGQQQQERSRVSLRSVSSISSGPDTQNLQQVTIGTLDNLNKDQNGTLDCEHDNLVKDHMSSRIAHLTKQLQVADSKSVNFYHETHSLYKQIILADKTKQKLTNELIESNKKFDQLQDELETTKRSYEEQLRMLSDHLCGMNERLTSQKDEIDELKTTTTKSNKFQLPGRKK